MALIEICQINVNFKTKCPEELLYNINMGQEFQILNWQETKKLVKEMQVSEKNSRFIAYVSLTIAVIALLISFLSYISDNRWQERSLKLLEEQTQTIQNLDK